MEVEHIEINREERPIGHWLRQIRRQRNMTQTQLGGTKFSKSYISAVERNKIKPSSEVLEYLAEKLGLPANYFIVLFNKLIETESPSQGSQIIEDQVFSLMQNMLVRGDRPSAQVLQELPTLLQEPLETLPPSQQALYFLLKGLASQLKQDFFASLPDLEAALPLASPQLRPAILDALGRNYYLTNSFSTSLSYHLRAFQMLEEEPSNGQQEELRFSIELHCGDDYCALGAYEQASEMYERAHKHLRAEHDLKTAAALFLALGFCLYMHTWQTAYRTAPPTADVLPESIAHELNKAIGFLERSISICQLSSDSIRESTARLTLAALNLDFCSLLISWSQKKSFRDPKRGLPYFTSLLEDAEEQCRRVFQIWQDPQFDPGGVLERPDTTIATALAYMVRVSIQRAALTRCFGSKEFSSYDHLHALHLCRQVVASLYEPAFSRTIMQTALTSKVDNSQGLDSSLPQLPEDFQRILHTSLSQVEVYLATGELAEEMGLTMMAIDDVRSCYRLANAWFQAALESASLAVIRKESNPGFLTQCYQRWAFLLENRSKASPALCEETSSLQMALIMDSFSKMQRVMVSTPQERC
jgi:transcriptional regulator with XRE-family HTH domain